MSRMLSAMLLVLSALLLSASPPAAQPATAPDKDIPPGATLHFHAGYELWDVAHWQNDGVALPDFGSMAEGYPGVSGYVCGMRLVLSRSDTMHGSGMIDAFVWEYDAITENPGAVLSVTTAHYVEGVPISPEYVTIDLAMTECWAGSNGFFVGFWPRGALGAPADFGVLADYMNPGVARTKYAPGLGYPTGWGSYAVAGYLYSALGLGGYVAESPTPVRESSWGAIKQLYR